MALHELRRSTAPAITELRALEANLDVDWALWASSVLEDATSCIRAAEASLGERRLAVAERLDLRALRREGACERRTF
jgi:hypothetical protein